jgi:RHS repeat-associated protein
MSLRAAFVPGALDDDPTAGGPPPVVTNGTVQALDYGYDNHRNVRYRYDQRFSPPIQDDFTPDALDRLSRWRTRSPAGDTTFEYRYDDATNLRERAVFSGTGTGFTLEHGGAPAQAGPNAVSGPALGYSYDLRGLQKTAPGRSVEYSADDLPVSMAVAGIQTSYTYDAFSNRSAKSASDKRAFYGPGYERREEDGKIIHVFDIPGDDRVVGQLFLEEQNGVIVTSPEYQYIHDDVLGSTETVTRGPGEVLGERVRWDPFGRQVQLLNPKEPTTGLPGKIRIGFTGHEQDQESGLINMRGRIYDPTNGHFLTPDPIVGAPFDGTAFNAYSYVLNNPVTLVDPYGLQADRPAVPAGPAIRGVPLPPRLTIPPRPSGTPSEDPRCRCGGPSNRSGPGPSGSAGGASPVPSQPQVVGAGSQGPSLPSPIYGPLTNPAHIWPHNPGGVTYAPFTPAKCVSSPCVGYTAGLGVGDGISDTIAPWEVVGFGSVRTVATRGTTKLFRAVGEAEFKQLMSTGKFAAGPNSLAGKFFAETAEHAQKWGEAMMGKGNFRIIEAELPASAADKLMRWERLDGIGPARYGELEQLVDAVVRAFR